MSTQGSIETMCKTFNELAAAVSKGKDYFKFTDFCEDRVPNLRPVVKKILACNICYRSRRVNAERKKC